MSRYHASLLLYRTSQTISDILIQWGVGNISFWKITDQTTKYFVWSMTRWFARNEIEENSNGSENEKMTASTSQNHTQRNSMQSHFQREKNHWNLVYKNVWWLEAKFNFRLLQCSRISNPIIKVKKRNMMIKPFPNLFFPLLLKSIFMAPSATSIILWNK